MKTYYSKHILILLITILSGCKAKQITSNVETVKFDETEWSETAVTDVAELIEIDSMVLENIAVDTSVIDSTIEEVSLKKAVYKVAVVLPFMEDSLRSAWSHAKEKNFQEFNTSQETDISSSFMEGMIMALKKQKLNSKFEFIVYDDKNDFSTIEGILEKIKEDSVDMIIGSYKKQNVLELAEFAKANNIIHFSPFCPSKSASAGNPKYYMFEPSLEQHLATMINYSIDSIKDPHIKFIYHDNEVSKFYASFVSSYIDSLNTGKDSTDKIDYKLITTPTSSLKMDQCLDAGANNVLIVNSFSETFIHTFLKQMNGRKSENITSFGMPGWENSLIVRLEYVSSANIHFTKSSWIDWENPKTINFEEEYKTKYGTRPKESAFLGYDFANFVFKTIDDIGLNFNKKVLGNTYNGLDRSFDFQKVFGSDHKVNRIENVNLRIYKIEDFETILIK